MVQPIIKHNKLILTIFNKIRNHVYHKYMSMTNGPVMSLVEMLNSQFPVTRPQPVTEADMTPEEIKLAEISEAKQAEEIISEVKTEESIKEVKPAKKTRKARS